MTPAVIIMLVWITAMLVMFYLGLSQWLARRRRRKILADPRAVVIPPQLLVNPPRRVADLAIGETAYILAAHVDADERGRAFLRDSIEVRSAPAGIYRDRIERTADGIRLTLRAGDLPAYRREPLYDSLRYLPVVSITIEETPEASS
jgi:hypothetical protein